MHAAPYGTRLQQARSESEPSWMGHGTMLGVLVALPRGQIQECGGQRIVALDPATVGVHPA